LEETIKEVERELSRIPTARGVDDLQGMVMALLEGET